MKKTVLFCWFVLLSLCIYAQEPSNTLSEGIKKFYERNYSSALADLERGILEYSEKKKDSIYVEHLHYKYLCLSWLRRWDESKETVKTATEVYEKLGHSDDLLGCMLARDYARRLYNGNQEEQQEFIKLMKRYVGGLEKGLLEPYKEQWVAFFVAGRFDEVRYNVFWTYPGDKGSNKHRILGREASDEDAIFKKKCLKYAYEAVCEALSSGNVQDDQWELVALEYAKCACQVESECVDIIEKVIKSRRKRLRPDEFSLYAEAFAPLSYFLSDEEFQKVVKYEKFVSYGNQYGKQLEVYLDYILAQHFDDIELYRAAFKNFEETNYAGNELNMYYCAQELANMYEEKRQYSSAAYYFEKAMALMNMHWKEWDRSCKYAKYPKNAANNGALELYYDLCRVYKEAKMYSRIVELSEEALNDSVIKADVRLKQYVYEYISEAKQLMGDYSGHKEANKTIEKYSQEPEEELTTDYVYKLLAKGDTLEAAQIIRKIAELGRYFYEPYIDYVYKVGDREFAIKYLEKYLYESGIEDYVEDFYAGAPIIDCMELLSSYYGDMGDYDRELKVLEKAWEVCRSNENSKDNNLSYSIEGVVVDGIKYEVGLMSCIGNYYFRRKNYPKGHEWYQMAFDRTAEFFNAYAEKWLDAKILEEWDERNWIFYGIEGLAKYAKDYPPVSHLILKASTVIKGFTMYLNKDIKDFYSQHGLQAKSLFEQISSNNKKIESLFYQADPNAAGLSELEADNDLLKVKVADLLSTSKNEILKIFSFDPTSFAKNLTSSEIVLDFFKVYTHTADSVVEEIDNYKIERRKPVSDLYCSILRREWKFPQIVLLQDDYNIYIDNTQNRLCDYLEQNKPSQINAIYTSQSLSDRIWDEIIKTGNIKEGETVNFIPTGILSELAIESLPCKLGDTMQDHYNIHRFSSYREIKHEPLLCAKSDDCLLVGGLNYGSGNYGSLRSSMNSVMRGATGIPDLPGTLNEISHISKLIGSHKVLKGKKGTENNFLSFDGKSPKLMHIATHGFSKGYAEEEEKRFLYGNRQGRYISYESRPMYMTGLYMAPSNDGLPTEGILTSQEISSMDLSNTKLAVLSACSTGRGEVTDNGVYGLQRGLKMAGVGALVMTFWDVPDETTTTLMNRFWDFWSTGNYSINQSLNKAKQELRAKYPHEPYLWNAFVILDGI